MVFRKGEVRDASGILALQERNLVTKISEEQKKNGFVTTPFTGEQLDNLVARDGLFVIDLNGTIAGYAVAAGWDYFSGRPMFDHMIRLFAEIEYKGVRIGRDNSFQYGPVCVDLSLRGTDAFPRLFATMRENMAACYAVGTTFINKVNGRSFRAHTEKAHIDVITEFGFNDNNYYGLAFLTK